MRKYFILALVTTAMVFTSCKDPNKPEFPDTDLTQRMGRGELFNA